MSRLRCSSLRHPVYREPFTQTDRKRKPWLVAVAAAGCQGPAQTRRSARLQVCARLQGSACPHACCDPWLRKKERPYTRSLSTRRGKSFVCSDEGCRYSSMRSGRLTKPVRTHTGNRRFVCPWDGCESSFVQSGNLTRHLCSHTGERRFVCSWDGCGCAFSQSDSLKRHVRIHTGEKNCICPHEGCRRAFAASGNLAQHLRIHSQERPFVCLWEGCRQAFTRVNSLTRHGRVHSGVRPYMCPWEGCGRAYAEAGSRTRHLRFHTGTRPFVCRYEDCRKSFVQASDLARHLCTHSSKKISRKKTDVCRNEGGMVSVMTPHYFSCLTAIRAGVLAGLEREGTRKRHSRSVASAGPATTAASGVRQHLDAGRSRPSDRAQPCSQSLMGHSCALSQVALPPTYAAGSLRADWLGWNADVYLSRQLPLAHSVEAAGQSSDSLQRPDDDKTFWQQLLSSAASTTSATSKTRRSEP